MVEPKLETRIICSVFDRTAPIAVKWEGWDRGVAAKWKFYQGRGYHFGRAQAVFSHGHGLIALWMIAKNSAMFRDFEFHYWPYPLGSEPKFHVDKDRLHRPATQLALRYLVVKDVNLAPFETSFGFPIDYHTRMEWLLIHAQSMKRYDDNS